MFRPITIAALFAAMPFAAAAAPIETPIEAPSAAGVLKGTMLAPAGRKSPVVLIIPGSGLADRDGNGPHNLRASTYRLIAEGLAAKGITTVRASKRGTDDSAGAAAGPGTVTIGGYAADVQFWIAAIRGKTGSSCVWLLGHSEGGLVALATSQGSKGICGLILAATAGRPMGQVLRDQLRSNSLNAALLPKALKAIDALEKGQHIDPSAMHPALLPLSKPEMQDFLIGEFALDPAKLIASYRNPILILQGERDIQVSVSDAERLKWAAPAARLVLLPNTNHVLKTVTSEDWAANAAAYSDPNLPLAVGVVDGIADFIAGPPQTRSP
jgi:pimeloyl-ACP methyl ester carboxylesterase